MNDGSPGYVGELSEIRQELATMRSFYEVAIKERDYERVVADGFRAERDALRAELREATKACENPSVNLTRTLPECIRALEIERKVLLHAVMEVRAILHASGRRPETCYEMSVLDAAIDAARGGHGGQE